MRLPALRPLSGLFRRVLIAAALVLCTGLSVSVQAQSDQDKPTEAQQFIQSLYGPRIEKAQNTRALDDDIELMSELLEIAPSLPKEPDARSAALVQIILMAMTSHTGYDLAEQASDQLADHKPDHAMATPRARLALYEDWYRHARKDNRRDVAERYVEQLTRLAEEALSSGDHESANTWLLEVGSIVRVNRIELDFDLRDKLQEARELRGVDAEVQRMVKAASERTLRPAEARRLTLLLTLQMSRFDDAKPYAHMTKDAGFIKGFSAAMTIAKNPTPPQLNTPAAVTPEHQYEAGIWYASLIDEPELSDRASERALMQARLAMQGFIDSGSQDKLKKARAEIEMRKLEERYNKLNNINRNALKLIPVLDPEEHRIRGRSFETRDGKLYVEGNTLIHLPVEGGGAYALTIQAQLEAPRESGLLVTFPVSGESGRLLIDIAEQRVTRVEGLAVIEKPAELTQLSEKKSTLIRLEVQSLSDKEAALSLRIDGKQVWKWKGRVSELTEPPHLPPNPAHFSMQVYTNTVFERIELERVKGK